MGLAVTQLRLVGDKRGLAAALPKSAVLSILQPASMWQWLRTVNGSQFQRCRHTPQACWHSRLRHLSKAWHVTVRLPGVVRAPEDCNAPLAARAPGHRAVLVDENDTGTCAAKLAHEAHRRHRLMEFPRRRQPIIVGQRCARRLLHPIRDLCCPTCAACATAGRHIPGGFTWRLRTKLRTAAVRIDAAWLAKHPSPHKPWSLLTIPT